MADFAEVKVVDSWDETASLRGMRVDLGALADAHRAPGQVVKVRASGGGEGFFALANAPRKGHAELLLKRGAPIADAVIEAAVTGYAVEATAPFGRGFPVDVAQGRNLLLLAAGSGITPIRAVVQHVVANRSQFGSVMLFYGQREPADFAYTKEHSEWTEAGVEVTLCASKPEHGWKGSHGYVQTAAAELGPRENTVAFLCGTKSMVADARTKLEQIGVPVDQTFLNF